MDSFTPKGNDPGMPRFMSVALEQQLHYIRPVLANQPIIFEIKITKISKLKAHVQTNLMTDDGQISVQQQFVKQFMKYNLPEFYLKRIAKL